MKKLSITEQIAALNTISIEQLKSTWRSIYKTEPPAVNRIYLEARIAHRLQELFFGGLSKESQDRLRQLHGESPKSNRHRHAKNALLPPIGAVLMREFKGTEYFVTVIRDGFEYEGNFYKSLSAIASRITGVQWNGWEFFGLRSKQSSL